MGKKSFLHKKLTKSAIHAVYAAGNHIISDYVPLTHREETFLLALSHGCLVTFWNNAVLSVCVLLPSFFKR